MVRADSSAQSSLRIVELSELFDSRSISNLLSSHILHLVIASFEIISLSLLDHGLVFHELMGLGVSAQRRAASVRIGSCAVKSLISIGTKHSQHRENFNPGRISQGMELKVHALINFLVGFGLTSPSVMSSFQLFFAELMSPRPVGLARVVTS